MVDLSGLAAFGGGFAGGLPQAQQAWMAVQQKQLELDQIKRTLAAQAAASTGFGGGDGMGQLPGSQPLPQAAPPQGGQPQIPMRQGADAQLPPGQIPGFAPRGGPPMSGAPPMGQPAPQPQMGGPPMPMGGTLTVEQLAERIRQRNPGIDGATLFQAVQQGAQLLNPESKMLLNFLMSQRRIEATERGQDTRLQGTEESVAGRAANVETQQAGATTRTGMQQAGAGQRAANAEAGRNTRYGTVSANVQARINASLGQPGGAKAAKALAAQHRKVLMAEIAALSSEQGFAQSREQQDKVNVKREELAEFERQNMKLLQENLGGETAAPAGSGTIKYDAAGNRVP